MICLEDCIALCGLSKEEVLLLAEHEHICAVDATAMGHYLLQQSGGADRIRDIIIDDVRSAQGCGDRRKVQTLLHVLHHFLKGHPEACRVLRP